ncbi:MAG: permease-like cell division protein FtsX [Bdellovibrionales bacterium]|nr:permease-like cell division protein FtsX [Bdellovibrionales bacterium]
MKQDLSAQQAAEADLGIERIWQSAQDMQPQKWPAAVGQVVERAAHSMLISPLVTVVSVLTMGVVLLLLAILIMFLQNVASNLATTQSGVTLTIFLRDDASMQATKDLAERLRARPQVEDVIYLDKASALTRFRHVLGDQSDLLDGLDQENPLPASLEVRFHEGSVSDGLYSSISDEFKQEKAVEHIQYSSSLLWHLGALLNTFRWVGGVCLIIMIILSSFIIGNTVKLALYSRQSELEIMNLVGATRAYVILPCLMEGLIQGLIGALIGILGLAGLYWACAHFITLSPEAGFITPSINFLSLGGVILVLCLGVLAGTAGSFLAARNFLGKFE